MKFLMILFLAVFACSAQANMRVLDQGNAQLGIFSKMKCGLGHHCSETSGFLLIDGQHKHLISTSTVATASMCGDTFINSADATVTLPEASSVPGCRFTFVEGAATWSSGTLTNLIVDPADGTDQILVLTNSGGDRIRNSTLGNSVVLEAVGDDQWAPVGKEQGTWTDVN